MGQTTTRRERFARPRDWVDFKSVKKAAKFEDVLAHYEVRFTKKGDELTASCPFHEDRKPSFKVNTAKGVFNCFGCNAKGNVIDFVQRKEGGTIRQAALEVARICGIETDKGEKNPEAVDEPTATPATDATVPTSTEDVENKPITISLKLDVEHPYLAGRNLSAETVSEFGLGFCSRGMMRNRIAIPIHSEQGELLAYAGRSTSDEELAEGEGKYKLPPKFHKSLVVYNLHRVPVEAKTAIVVEGYFSVFWLRQCGFRNVVSIMGSSLSERQRQLLCERFKGVTLFFDGDEAGRKATNNVAAFLVQHLWVRSASCPDGKQPDELAEVLLRDLLH